MTNSITPYDCWLNRTNGGRDLERDLSRCKNCNELFYDKSGNVICDECNENCCEECGDFTDGYFEPLCEGCRDAIDPVNQICMGY